MLTFKGVKLALHILQHKSWHVWNEDNVTKVRQDEAKAKALQDEREKKFLAAEADARLVRLRRAAVGDTATDAPPELDLLSAPPSTVAGDADYEAEKAKKLEGERKALGIRDFKFEDVMRLKPWYATSSGEQAELLQQHVKEQRPGRRSGRAPLPAALGGEDEDPLVSIRARVAAAKSAEARLLEEQPPPSLTTTAKPDPRRGSRFASSASGADYTGGYGSSSRDRTQVSGDANAPCPPHSRPSALLHGEVSEDDPRRSPRSREKHRHSHRDRSPDKHSRGRTDREKHKHRRRDRSRSAEGGSARDGERHHHHSQSHSRSHRHSTHKTVDASGSLPQVASNVPSDSRASSSPAATSTSWDSLRLQRLLREAEEHQRANAALMRATDDHPGSSSTAVAAVSAAAVAQALMETAGLSPHKSHAALSSQYNPHLARQRGSRR